MPSYSSGTINIPNVTGNIVITAVATQAIVSSISAVFTQGAAIIYTSSSLDDLRSYLVVTATYDDSTTATITSYTLSGTLTEGTSTITVSYGGKTATFTVTVTNGRALPSGYTNVDYIQTNGNAYIDTGLKEIPGRTSGFWGIFSANVASTNVKSLWGYQGVYETYPQVSSYRFLALATTDNGLKYYAAATGLSSAISGWSANSSNDITVSLTDDATYPVWTVNETLTTGNKPYTPSYKSTQGNIYLLAQNYGGIGPSDADIAVDGSYVRCYGFKIFESGTAVRDYVPCVRSSDSAAGFYDYCTQAFYPSIGENAFTAGNEGV